MARFYQIIDISSVLNLEIIHYMSSSKVGLQNYYVMVGNFILKDRCFSIYQYFVFIILTA